MCCPSALDIGKAMDVAQSGMQACWTNVACMHACMHVNMHMNMMMQPWPTCCEGAAAAAAADGAPADGPVAAAAVA